MPSLDPRIVRIGINIAGETSWYEGLYMTAQGTRFGNDTLNECQVRIDNLDRAHRDEIMTRTTPWYKQSDTGKSQLIVMAGRKSYGASLIFTGYITITEMTQPPDIGIIIQAKTTFASALNTIAYSAGPSAPLSAIAQKAAADLNIPLNFQAKDRNIANYSLSGAASLHVNKIAEAANVDSFVDNNTLIVTDKDKPLLGSVKSVNMNTGMVGIPEIIEQAIRVRFLLDNVTAIKTQLNVTSLLNPSISGPYVIYKLGFSIASRDTDFYWIAECKRLQNG